MNINDFVFVMFYHENPHIFFGLQESVWNKKCFLSLKYFIVNLYEDYFFFINLIVNDCQNKWLRMIIKAII